jgi:predicted esterase
VEGRELALAAWEQAFHTPPMALATMLHRGVVLAHGAADAWADADESVLLAQVLADAGNEPVVQLIDGAGHELGEAPEARIGAFAETLVARMEPRDLPPVLMAIEGMA